MSSEKTMEECLKTLLDGKGAKVATGRRRKRKLSTDSAGCPQSCPCG